MLFLTELKYYLIDKWIYVFNFKDFSRFLIMMMIKSEKIFFMVYFWKEEKIKVQ
jgi:hypothetical protein